MKYELKPCPFCGGKAVFDEDEARKYAEGCIADGIGYLVQVSCPTCHATVADYDHYHKGEGIDAVISAVVETWNRRPTDKTAEYEKLCVEADNATANLIRVIERNTILEQTIVNLAIEHAGADKEGEY